jgi:hypothetical protein
MPYYLEADQEGHSQTEAMAEALFYLTDTYGLQFSGIGNSVPETGVLDEESPALITYVTTGFVDGIIMHEGFREIPIEITLDTLDKILRYYQDMVSDPSDRLYLTDLSLRQFIYGSLATLDGEPASSPDAYLIDVDDFLSNRQRELGKPEGKRNDFRDAIGALIGNISKLEWTFIDLPLVEQKERLTAIAAALNIELEHPPSERW